MELFWDLMKVFLPAFMVFLTAYVFLKNYFEKNIILENMKLNAKQSKMTLNQKLLAYERLALLAERLNLTNILLRVKQPDMTVAELKYALLTTIQVEFEHNVTQQIYVSQDLWDIIKMAKDFTVNLVLKAEEGLDPRSSAQPMIDNILSFESQLQSTAWDKALIAIKNEVSKIL
ncbi:MAG: hypothetical protein KBA06_00980 [Saprospiraceae bacterium]|nr:hypothetical protein [Saprospiraceae bacterium]